MLCFFVFLGLIGDACCSTGTDSAHNIRLNSNFSTYCMPDESCRCCGGSLADRKVCKKCFQSTSEACTECGNHTLEKFHVMCNLADNNSEVCQTRVSMV